MNKTVKLLALATCFVSAMSCNQKKEDSAGYIGPSDIKIEDGVMTPEALLSLGRLSDPQIYPSGGKILYGVTYNSLEDNRSCRNIFIINDDGTGKKQLTYSGKSISNARWIHEGKSVAYIMGGQIYVAKVIGMGDADNSSVHLGKAVKVSDVTRGISEFKLSPDEKMVMYVSTVPGKVTSPADSDPALDKAKAYVTENLMYRHWDHWVTELPHTFISAFNCSGIAVKDECAVDILQGEMFELPTEPFGGIEQLDWSPDGRFIAYSCKKLGGKEYAFSTDTEIYIYEVASGKSTIIPMGGGYDTEPVWSPDGKKLSWISMARNGYEADKSRLMVADVVCTEGVEPVVSDIRDLTENFKYNAAGPVWSHDSKYLYFNALAEGLQGIFAVCLERGNNDACSSKAGETAKLCTAGKIMRLTPENAWYDFNSPFAVLEDGTLLANYCSMDFPNELVAVCKGVSCAGTTCYESGLVCGSEEGFKQITHENDHILSQIDKHLTEAHYVKTVDGKDMLTWVLYPPEFDSTKIYPAIEILLGGPQGTLSQSWSYRWNYRLMASQGYIVVLPNRRGTTAFGQKWTEQISGDYVGLNIQDYLSAARWAKNLPFVGKLAGCGASYGGFSAYYLAGVHKNTYDCFIAHAGIFDEKYMYYETEEMWFPNWDNGGLSEYNYAEGNMGPAGDGITFGGMKQGGSPWSSNAKAKRHYSNSPDLNVTKWNTPILCIHGGMDFRIPYDQGMAAFNAAQMMGVPSKLIVFPEENHWILQPQNALFWHRSYFEWLDRWCK